MKFALIKERKIPADPRVVFSPSKLVEAKKRFPKAIFRVESSAVRVFPDEAYSALGFEVTTNVSDCDVFIGIKEVPIQALIPNKKYIFFSHTIKKQPHNRALLQAIIEKNITLYDHETMVNQNGKRLIGFGKYAGIVGVYNGFRTWGLKYNTWQLPKASTLLNQEALLNALKSIKLPNLKILLTGNGKVAHAAKNMLDAMEIREVLVNEYVNGSFNESVYCKIHVSDYNKHKGQKPFSSQDFYKNPENYESNFMRFAKVTDFFITGHFYAEGAPYLYTKADVKSEDFNIKVVADISCDVAGPIATTIRASDIINPIYGYDKQTGAETNFKAKNAIAVMAVNNLPCEIPQDASEGFGDMFLEHIMPAFFNQDANGILERAKITENGKLTKRFAYLQAYVDGKIH
ncbi:NAD(P)-dependent oxidoreductase [Tamlana sp. I1]|uniref:NAD(P)-dependent oxidoreductase n=1 Tax=Tamlana sp. I1 TaxID=2762061 RepID=UPI00188FD8CA|nr:NAD(P)-dependent oxidoreductase [Tamlana sp. I1]